MAVQYIAQIRFKKGGFTVIMIAGSFFILFSFCPYTAPSFFFTQPSKKNKNSIRTFLNIFGWQLAPLVPDVFAVDSSAGIVRMQQPVIEKHQRLSKSKKNTA